MPSPPFNRLKTCRHGQMLYNVNDQYVGRSLDLYGEYSEHEAELFAQFVRPGDIVVEVGANLGALTLPLANLVGPTGVILAFEPQRVVFQTLCANMALNSITHAHCYCLAVGEADGQVRVPPLDYGVVQNFGGLALGTHGRGEPTPVVPLDRFHLPRLRLLKVDVEGMELQVLRGADRLIRQHQPILYVENDRPQNAEPLIRHIAGLGYRMAWHRPPLFNPRNFAGNADNVFGNIVSLNMLCVPAGSKARLEGFAAVDVPPPVGPSSAAPRR